MSNPIQSMPTPAGAFQAHFGAPPGSADAVAECKKWEKVCADLLAEREMLREELAQMGRMHDACQKALFQLKFKDYEPPMITDEEALAYLDQAPSVAEIMEGLRNAPGK